MDLQDIKGLIDLIRGTEVVELEVERSGYRVKIRRGEAPSPAPSRERRPGPTGGSAAGFRGEASSSQEYTVSAVPAAAEADRFAAITSPIVGTFYRSPSPEKDPYVEVGDTVKKGQVVCIVEAMKLMNEIEAEMDGKVAEVLVESGHPVEYGEPLFRIEPAG